MSGKVSTAKKGGWNGGHIPYGYRKIEGSQYDFDIQPDEAAIVKKIFQLYLQGNGYLKIKQITGCPLSTKGISKLIDNPFYCGKVQFNGIIESNNGVGHNFGQSAKPPLP